MIKELAQYQIAALRTEKPLPTQMERLEHALLGMITETGEIATEVKRMAIYGKQLDDIDPKTKKSRREHIAEEIGDVLWYLAIASDAVGADIFVCQRISFPPATPAQLVFSLTRVNGHFVDILVGHDQTEELPVAVGLELRIALDALGSLANLIEIPLDEIAVANIEKLRARFPDAYSNEAAEARADKGGLDARNS